MSSFMFEHHWTDCGLQTKDMNLTHCFVSEKDGLNGLRHTEYKIQTFLKESLIPLARQHNALVIVSNSSCSLSQVFGKLCAAEAERRRGNLGFYVLSFLQAPHLLLSCKNPDTIAFQLRRASKNWRKYEDKMWYVLKKTHGEESMFYNHYMDAPDGCTHYIIADCISEDENGLKRDWAAIAVLRSRLVQAMLSSQIPGFGVATLQRMWGYRDVIKLADDVARGIPLLLLDSRDPPHRPVQSVQEAVSHLSQLDDDLAQEGTGNFYNTSTLAFLHQALLGLLHRSHARRSGAGGKIVEDRITKDSRVPLWQQVETLEEETFVNDASMESMEDNTCILRQKDARHSLAESLVEGFLTMMGNKMTLAQPNWDVSEVPKDHFKNILRRTVGELLRCNSKANLDEFLEHYSICCLSTEHLNKITSFKNAPFCVKHGMKAGTLFKRILQVAPGADWKDAKQYMFTCLKEDCSQFDGKFKPRSHLPHSPDIKGVFMEVLVSPLTHSANLMDLTRIEKVLMLVNVDRRVHGVGLTSCQVLQRAWADVDVYHHVASQMKWVAKISYAIVLLTGYAITVLTIVNVNVPDAMPEDTTNYIVLGLSVSVGVTSALLAYIDPTTKWQQLRAAALTLEAEIWKFRSSAGVYTRDMMSNYVESAEETLSHFVSVTEDSVLKSAGVSESSFLSTFSFSRAPTSVRIYKHGQYQGAAWKGAVRSNDAGIVDDHYSPLTAREYMALRFESHVQFYQRRLPKYARKHTLHQFVLAIASGLLTILVFFGESRWCALCTAGVAAATAWIEFSSTKRKMRRYSETVHQAHQVLLWWQSLQRMQQTANFTVLVQRCEACFASEYSSWVSSMSAQREAQRKVGNDLDENGDPSQKDKSHVVTPDLS